MIPNQFIRQHFGCTPLGTMKATESLDLAIEGSTSLAHGWAEAILITIEACYSFKGYIKGQRGTRMHWHYHCRATYDEYAFFDTLSHISMHRAFVPASPFDGCIAFFIKKDALLVITSEVLIFSNQLESCCLCGLNALLCIACQSSNSHYRHSP